MRIQFDEFGEAMPDVSAPGFAQEAVAANRDVHISNGIVFDWLRGTLKSLPKERRPEVTWSMYGHDVSFDDDLRTDWWPPETELAAHALEILIGWRHEELKPPTDEQPRGRVD